MRPMAEKKIKTLNVKRIIRITNVSMILLSLAILGVTGWFLMSALSDSPGAAASQDSEPIETLDLKALEKVLQSLAEKRSGGEALTTELRNPFVRPARPAPAPPPQPQPAPEPAPAPAPTPPPAT